VNDRCAWPLTSPQAGSLAPAAPVIIIPTVVTAGSVHVNVVGAASVVVDDFNAGMSAVVMTVSVAPASGKA